MPWSLSKKVKYPKISPTNFDAILVKCECLQPKPVCQITCKLKIC